MISNSMKYNTSIKSLKLEKIRITSKGAYFIAQFISENSTLIELYLARNQISDVGAIAISESLEQNSVIRTLDLRSNIIHAVTPGLLGKNFQVFVLLDVNPILSVPSQFTGCNELIMEYLKTLLFVEELEFDDNTSNIKYILEKIKLKNERRKTKLIYEEQEKISITQDDKDNYKNSQLNYQEVETVRNISKIIFEMRDKPFMLSEILDQEEFRIQKNVITLRVKSEEYQYIAEEKYNQTKIYNEKMNSCYGKFDVLLNELIQLESECRIIENEYFESLKEYENSMNKVKNTNVNVNEVNKIFKEIQQIKAENEDFFRDWNVTISNKNLDLWSEEQIKNLLESLKLGNWFEPIKENFKPLISLSKLAQDDSVELLTTLYDKKNIKMTFGEAKYISLVIQEINKMKRIPQIFNDIDLNVKNVKSWTVENVKNFYVSIKLNRVGECLSVAKVNGLVLFNIKKSDLKYLGIEKKYRNKFMNSLNNICK